MQKGQRNYSHIKTDNLSDLPALVTVPEAAQVLRLDEASVRRHLSNKKIPGLKIGGRWRIRRNDLVHLLMPEEQPRTAA